MPEEAPHTNPSICKNALATALVGARETNLLDQLEAVDRELTRIERAAGDPVALAKHVRVARAELLRACALLSKKP
jgi:hypothetical protein